MSYSTQHCQILSESMGLIVTCSVLDSQVGARDVRGGRVRGPLREHHREVSGRSQWHSPAEI